MKTALRRIPLSIPELGPEERARVLAALDSGWVSTGGPLVGELERGIAQLLNVPHAVAVASGTAAIHLGLVLAGVRSGDAVIVPPLTFIGTSNPILYCGGVPILVDVRESDGTLDPDALAAYLRDGTTRADGVLRDRTTGAPLRAILPVHLYGAPADLTRISALAADAGLAVVEDAAESLGSLLDGRACGSFGVVGCLSFNGNKIITTGGGGMIVTSDERLARRGRHLSTQARIDPIEYRHDDVGYNYRLTNIQAALGLGQLDTFPHRLERKRAMAARYRKRLTGMPLRFLEPSAGSRSNYWLTAIVLEDPTLRQPLLAALDGAGIESRSFFVPLQHQAPYSGMARWGSLARSDALYARGLNLPSSVGSIDEDIDRVCDVVTAFLAAG